MLAGAMPASIGKRSVGVGRRHPVTILMVSLRVASIFYECVLRHHTGVAYSAVVYTSARGLVRSVLVLAPQDAPARHLSRLFRDVSLAQGASVCCLYARCRSSFTPKYVGMGYVEVESHPGR